MNRERIEAEARKRRTYNAKGERPFAERILQLVRSARRRAAFQNVKIDGKVTL